MPFLALLGVVWAASWLLVPASGLWLSGGGAFALLAVAVALFGVGECLHGAVQAPLVADLADHRLIGRYMAISALSWQVGFTIGPAVGRRAARGVADGPLDRGRDRLPARGRRSARSRARLARGRPPHAARSRRRPALRWRSSIAASPE